MSNKKLVKDYQGNLVPKATARKIQDQYYTENKSCFLMPDGQWYRITSPKLVFDHYSRTYILASTGNLYEGLIDEKGSIGKFSASAPFVTITDRKGARKFAMTEDIATKAGYVECIADGNFYYKADLTKDDDRWFYKKDIPKNERSSDYNLESSPDRKKELVDKYVNAKFPISVRARSLAKHLGDLSFGMEVEVINGFIPKRIRDVYGVKALKDGSLRHGGSEGGGEGIEYVTMPMSGPKGIQTIMDLMKEFSKRCDVNNFCSLHYHFGNVRKDKLYVLSLYKVMRMIQGELKTYFPFSRFNSIKPDGKIYCKLLENLNINERNILKQTSEEEFKKSVVSEFNKFYTWLNNGKGLNEEFAPPSIVRQVVEVGGKKMFYDSWLRNIYSTKIVQHAISGQKWDKPQRYYIINFLNLFFNSIGTIEFRCHESTTNATKALIWLLTCASILRFAEDIDKVFRTNTLSLKEILVDKLPCDMAAYIMEYFNKRNNIFYNNNGSYKEKWDNIEKNWFAGDPNFTFESSNNYKLL
jgi:hypothetical protein